MEQGAVRLELPGVVHLGVVDHRERTLSLSDLNLPAAFREEEVAFREEAWG